MFMKALLILVRQENFFSFFFFRSKIIIIAFGNIVSRVSTRLGYIGAIHSFGNQFSLDGREDRGTTRDNPDILIYFIHNERGKVEKKRERGEKRRER